MKPIRAVFTFEAALTVFGGLQALLTPASSAALFVAEPLSPTALDFVRWLGAMWLVIAALEFGLLRRGTREAWLIALPAILLGDVLHLSVHAKMLADGALWNTSVAASIALSVIYAVCRVLVILRPERVMRGAESLARA